MPFSVLLPCHLLSRLAPLAPPNSPPFSTTPCHLLACHLLSCLA